MASSRQSTPTSDAGSPSPTPLTPNSKVQAMLAALDKDSEDEHVDSGSARERLLASMAKSFSPKPLNTRSLEVEETGPLVVKGTSDINEGKGSQESRDGIEDNEEDDDEDEEIFRPKGRMAARMLTVADEINLQGDTPDDSGAHDGADLISAAKINSSQPMSDAGDEDRAEDSDGPVAARKRKIQRGRRSTPTSTSPRISTSPNLFITPQKSESDAPSSNDSDSDELPANPTSNERFKALVEKKRQERLAKEAMLAKEKEKKAAERRMHSDILEEDDGLDDSDGESGRRLTQQVRPTRKASKKALEEMHRETQRMSRNQQLAHNAITKKKITKASLFAKFNFRTAKTSDEHFVEPARPSSSSSAAAHSDVEMKDTPPTSPASQEGDGKQKPGESGLAVTSAGVQEPGDGDTELSSQMQSSPPTKLDKGKDRAVEESIPSSQTLKKPIFKQRPIRVHPPKLVNKQSAIIDESDSDLEIVTVKTPLRKREKLHAIFERVPVKQAEESHSLHALRMLAHLTSPNKQDLGRNKKPSMTTVELQMSLQQRARQQAVREREERLQALRDKGVIIQTAEEREKEMVEVDDLLAQARRQEEELRKREKAAAKKERKEKGEVELSGDSSDDEDWKEGKENLEEELSASGSDDDREDTSDEGSQEEEEEEEEEGEDGDEEEAIALEEQDADKRIPNALLDDEAGETDDDEADGEMSDIEEMKKQSDGEEDEDENPLAVNKRRRSRKSNVISDDEDDGELIDEKTTPSVPQTKSPLHLQTDSPLAPNSVLRSATKTFIPGLTVAGPAGLGLTQIFAGTMDESQIHDLEDSQPGQIARSPLVQTQKDSLAFLRRAPAPTLPPFVPTMPEDTQDSSVDPESQYSHIPQSQDNDSISQKIEIDFTQSQIQGFDSLISDSQLSPFPEATQDVGFQHMTPIRGRFVDASHSTTNAGVQESSTIPEITEETPLVKKKGKLRRRAPQLATFSDEEETDAVGALNMDQDDFDITENVFDVMRKASKKKIVVEEFDKTKSKAKEMVHEQAEESEDEYAGLGGASDDESGEEEDAYVKEMIDDEAGKDLDESKLAAFFADRERASDEKQVEKLYNDITKGMLRRKRGADYDLSDSDDGGEARQRRKRKEFAKMRKALLADERIGKIAENPKKQAFLRAIEDRGSEDETDFLDDFVEQEDTDSQSQSQVDEASQVVPDSQPTATGAFKRKHSDSLTKTESRLPPNLRRNKQSKKPSNLSEIRESLSSLIEEPNGVVAPAESDSEDELEIEGDNDLESRKEKGKENRDPFALRRTNIPVVDRISLKRASSSSISNSTRLAFATSTGAPGFKVPPLLRRATTNSSIASTSSSGSIGTERSAGGGSGSDGIKRGGGKNSGVNYFARESERRARVVKGEKRREERLAKGAQVRRKVVGGLFGGGTFE